MASIGGTGVRVKRERALAVPVESAALAHGDCSLLIDSLTKYKIVIKILQD
jgi:hypothetical protein